MHIIINSSLMVPIYEQIMEQIKTQIRDGSSSCKTTVLPSVRALSKELKISALTVKKAYDHLESEDSPSPSMEKEPMLLQQTRNFYWKNKKKKSKPIWNWRFQKGRRYGLSTEEIRSLFELILEDSTTMLKINHLKKNYPSFSLDCSLHVAPGCITGLIGQNGSGKKHHI